MSAPKSPDLNIMIRAAEKAARSLIRDFGEVEQLQVSRKGPGDFVSAADKRAEKILFEELQKARPDYSFLMEESGQVEGKKQDHVWIIDPLDGTTNFLHGIPHWAISIGLQVEGQMKVGLVYDPVKDEIFTAEHNGGAFMKRKRLRVSGRTAPDMAVVATGAPKRSSTARKKFNAEYFAVQSVGPSMRRFGAAALDLAYVAAGRCEAFWERDLSPWDVAAGMLIVKEAGGFVSDIDDNRNNVLETGNIVAGNERLFNDVRKVLKAV